MHRIIDVEEADDLGVEFATDVNLSRDVNAPRIAADDERPPRVRIASQPRVHHRHDLLTTETSDAAQSADEQDREQELEYDDRPRNHAMRHEEVVDEDDDERAGDRGAQ